MYSFPANADTNINNVDCGKWKFVINPSMHLNVYPGYMNICVSPSIGSTVPFSGFAIVSNTLHDVVPTAITLFHFSLLYLFCHSLLVLYKNVLNAFHVLLLCLLLLV